MLYFVRIKYVLLFGFVFSQPCLKAQEKIDSLIEKEWINVFQAYAEKESFGFDIRITTYYDDKDATERNVIDESHVTYKHSGDKIFWLRNRTETITNSSFSLLVDHQTKTIYYKEISAHEKQVTSSILNENGINGNTCQSLVAHSGNGLRTITCILEDSDMQSIKLMYEEEKGGLKSLVYLYHEDDDGYTLSVEVNYQELSAQESGFFSDFDKAQYIQILDSKIVPVEKLKGYEIITVN